MAQPSDTPAQPDAEALIDGAFTQPPKNPDRHIVSEFHAEVVSGPQGGRFLAVHCYARNEILLLDFSDDRGAEVISDELKPSRVVTPGDSRNGSGPGGAAIL
jgi:hypothetical protein